MRHELIVHQRNGVLTEIGPDQSEIRLEAAEIAAYGERIGALLGANQSDGPHLVVACFMWSWQAIAAAQAALSRGLSFQPWQGSSREPGWRDLRLRCEKLRGMAIKPVLLINPQLMAAFKPANLELFQSVIEIDLADASLHPATTAPTSARPLKPDGRVLVETAGTSNPSRTVALPLSELQYRANLAQQSTDDGVWLEVAPFDTAHGIERIPGPSRDTVVINADLAADDPLKILDLASRHGVTDLHLTPGHVSRLLPLLDGDRPLPDLGALRTVIVSGTTIVLPDVVRLSEHLEAAGVPDLHVQFDYRTAECGLIASTGRVRAHALADTVGQGAHVSLGHGVGDTELQVVDGDLEPLRDNEIGQIQVRRTRGVATHYIEAGGTQTRLGDETGWVDTGDLGFLDGSGLTITSRLNASLTVPRRSFEVSDIESPLSLAELQQRMAQVWQSTLRLDDLPRHDDDVFTLGADSLALATMLTEVENVFKRKVDIEAFFTNPTIEGLCLGMQGAAGEEPGGALAGSAAGLDGEGGGVEVPPNLIPAGCEAITPEMLPLVQLTSEEIERIADAVPGGAANIQDIYPLTPMQAGILFHHQMTTEGDPYLMSSLLGFDTRERLQGYLHALQAVIDRHDILRTSVLWEGLPEPVQVVWRQAPVVVEEVSIATTAGDVAQQLRARFDPRHYRLDLGQAPLMRIFIAHDAANARWVMLQFFHHVSSDATTAEIVQQEVQAHLLGQAAQLPAPLPYRNFVAQARLGVSREEHKAFFHKMLGDVDEPTTPFGLTDVRGDGSNIAEASQQVDASVARRLRAGARMLGVSAASVFHLAWAQVLARVSGRDDVVFGTVLSGRMLGGSGAARGLGLFINTLPVRIKVGDESALDSIRHTHALLGQLLLHEHAPLALALRCSALAPPMPLFSALLNYRHSAPAEARQAQEGMQSLGFEERTSYPLTLSVDQLGEEFALIAQVQSGIDPQRVCSYMHAALEQLVDALESAPARPLRSLDVMPETERHRLVVEWNDTAADYPQDRCIHQLFEDQAARTPKAVAVVFEGQQLTYGELNARANQLAHHLIALGVGPEGLVGLCLKRSLDLVVGLLGILKAGGAYVPLDPGYPRERLAFMLKDSQVPVLLTQHGLLDQLPPYGGRVVCLDRDWPQISAPDQEGAVDAIPDRSAEPDVDITSLSPAYVIYTSGSTGVPRGVIGLHQGIVNRLSWMWENVAFAPGEVCCQKTSLSFVDSVCEIFGPLLQGFPLVIASDECARDPRRLIGLLSTWLVTRIVVVPSLLTTLLENYDDLGDRLPRLKLWSTSGEALSPELLRRFKKQLPLSRLINLYGSSEVAADVTCFDTGANASSSSVAIGRPIANTQVYILGRQGEPVPMGAPGELYVGGAGLARGYLNLPELTAEKFPPDPFSAVPGARMYRTGDLARHLPDGNIEFLGRVDDQVKIRGFRIELGEIEAVLAEYPAVRQAVVQAREDSPGDKRLVAYVVPADPSLTDAGPLRALLRERLPEYMRPAAYVLLDHLALTPSGKVDRRALPPPQYGLDEAGNTFVAPRDPIEKLIAEVWCKELKLERVSVHDNFFELGGDSLLAIKFVLHLQERAGVELPIEMVFESPTLAVLAEQLCIDDQTAGLSQAGSAGTAPLSIRLKTQVGALRQLIAISDILGKQNDYVRIWKGKRSTPESFIFTLNDSGRRRGLFWCFQGEREFTQLSKHLGPDQPVHGMRSGHLIMKYTPENISAIATRYSAEMIALQPDGPFIVGGTCQGGVIARAIALRLRKLGHTVSKLILMESGSFPPYDGPVALIYGSDSDLNPYNPDADPASLLRRGLPAQRGSFDPRDDPAALNFDWDSELNPYRPGADPDTVFRRAYPAGFTVDIIAGPHDKLFEFPHIKAFSSTLNRHLHDLSDRGWIVIHLNKAMASPLNRLIPRRPRTPLDPTAPWGDILDTLKKLPFKIPVPDDFDEAQYLAAYPDVAEACSQGKFSSGYEHYIKSGRTENRQRPTRPG